jgi:hypothetical protein
MRFSRRVVAGLSTVLLAVSFPMAVSVPVSASSTFVATPNGMVGLQQAVTLRAERLAGQVATVTFTSGSVSNAGQTMINSDGFGSLPWTPTTVGEWTISATVSGVSLGSTTITVAAMPTRTTALVPNLVQVGKSNPVQVTVSASIGQIPPEGTIELRNQNENVLNTATLSPTQNTSSDASLSWTPATGETITAYFVPRTSGFTPSASASAQPVMTTDHVPIAMRFPDTLYAGTPAPIGAQIGNGVAGGSAAFFFDGEGIIGSTPTDSRGGVTSEWTPPTSGSHTLSTQFSSNDRVYTGTSRQVVKIQPAKTPDAVTLTFANDGTLDAGSVASLPVGTSVTVVPRAESGSVVVLQEFGPCVINASTLNVLAQGDCTVLAISPGGKALTPAKDVFTIRITAASSARATT